MKKAQITFIFADTTLLTFLRDYEEGYSEFGEWTGPFDNTVNSSYVYGELEALGQGESYIGEMLREKGDPIFIKSLFVEQG
jgi:hypothetical protein